MSAVVTPPRTLFVRPLLLLLSLSLLPARAGAEGSTLPSEKVGACGLLTAADAQRILNVPMEFQPRAPGSDSPGRTCAYRPARPGAGAATVELRLLDAREWSRLKAQAGASKREGTGIKGVGDEAYVFKTKQGPRGGELVLFVRRRSAQFSVRFIGAGLELTDAMKELARAVARRLWS